MTGDALLSRYGLRPARLSSAHRKRQVGQIYFGDQAGKWVRFKSALTRILQMAFNALGGDFSA